MAQPLKTADVLKTPVVKLPEILITPAESVAYDSKQWGWCENERTQGWDALGLYAMPCNSSARFREDLQMYLCDHCYREVQ